MPIYTELRCKEIHFTEQGQTLLQKLRLEIGSFALLSLTILFLCSWRIQRFESTKVLYERIKKIEPEYAPKIIGYLLLQDHGDQDMIRFAFSPDHLIESLINQAKRDLGLSSAQGLSGFPGPGLPVQMNPRIFPGILTSLTPFSSAPLLSPATLQPAMLYFDPQALVLQLPLQNSECVPSTYVNSAISNYDLWNQSQFLSLEDQLKLVNFFGLVTPDNHCNPQLALASGASSNSPGFSEPAFKICHHFSNGYCNLGGNCNFYHSCAVVFKTKASEIVNGEHLASRGSLQKLEAELTMLLKFNKGIPLSITAMPMLYCAKYGKTLLPETNLGDIQGQETIVSNLIKILAQMQNSIRLIERPRGQYSIILAQDVAKYKEMYDNENDYGAILPGSQQIYLTFPAECRFTERNIHSYFSKFGPIEDIRVPPQQKRMYCFVIFASAETAMLVLGKKNPHFICGERVLVKPYRVKAKPVEKRYQEKIQQLMHHTSQSGAKPMASGVHLLPMLPESVKLLKRQQSEEKKEMVDHERKPIPVALFDNAADELFQGVGESSPGIEGKVKPVKTLFEVECDEEVINLPDSPFSL